MDESTTLGQALDMMYCKHILSIPVTGKEQAIIGVIDILDILSYIVFGNFKIDQEDYELTKADLNGEKLKTVTIGDLIGLSDQLITGMWHDGVFVLKAEDTIDKALEFYSEGVKRVLIDFSDGKTSEMDRLSKLRVLSQIDVMKFIELFGSQTREIGEQTIEDAGLLASDRFNALCTISVKDSALKGFRKMIMHKADAVAVVDDVSGQIVATLSASDVRYLYGTFGTLERILLPVIKFLIEVHWESMVPPITVKATDTVSTAVKKLIVGNVHRIWAVDDDNKPIACVRLQDVLVKYGPLDYKHAA